MRVLVTGGAGFIGSHFARRLQAAGDDVRVLDKLTYAGNLDNLRDIEGDARYRFVQGDICDAAAVEAATDGVDAIVNFAAESQTSTARSWARPTSSGLSASAPTSCLRRCAAATPDSSRCRRTRSTATSTTASSRWRPTSSSREPVLCRKAAADLHVRVRADVRLPLLDNAAREHRRPEPAPGKVDPADARRTPSRNYRCRSTATASRTATGSWSTTTAAGIDLVLREGEPGEVYNVGVLDDRYNVEIVAHILDLIGADESLIRYVEDRAGHDRRYSSLREAARARLVAAERRSTRASRRRSLVRGEPELVGSRSRPGTTRRTTTSNTPPAWPPPAPSVRHFLLRRSSSAPRGAAC